MNIKVLKNNEILFRQGEPAEGMYYIQAGKVGIYTDYGTEKQKKIEDLFTDQFVGEMGVLCNAPRSATVVSLMDNTQVEYLTEEDFCNFFQQNPPKVIQLMQQLCFRLRRITRKYLEECREAYDLIDRAILDRWHSDEFYANEI